MRQMLARVRVDVGTETRPGAGTCSAGEAQRGRWLWAAVRLPLGWPVEYRSADACHAWGASGQAGHRAASQGLRAGAAGQRRASLGLRH